MRLLDDLERQIPDAVQRIVDAVFGKNVEITVSEEGNIILSFCIANYPCQLFLVDQGLDDWRMIGCVGQENRDFFAEPALKSFLEFGNHFERHRLKLLLMKIAGVLQLRYVHGYEDLDSGAPHIADSAPTRSEATGDGPFQNDAVVDAIDPVAMPPAVTRKKLHDVLKLGAALSGVALISGLAAYVLLEKGASVSNGLHITSQPVGVVIPASLPQTHLPIPSVHTAVIPTGSCRIFSTIVQSDDRGPRPVLQRLQNEYPTELRTLVFDARTFTRLSIGPRHRAQQRARDAHDPRHAIAVTRHFHFNPPVVGDKFTVYVCSTSIVLIHSDNSAVELYRTELTREI